MSVLKVNEIQDLDGTVVFKKGETIANDSVEYLSQLLNVNPNAKAVVNVLNYHNGLEGGGGVFYWDANKAKSAHNGGTIIDPSVAFPSVWDNTTESQTAIGNWFNTSNTDTGCWVRQYDGAVNVKWFGAKVDGVSNDTTAIKSAGQLQIESVTVLSNRVDLQNNARITKKDLNSFASRANISSMPNLYKKLSNWNDATSTSIKIVGMGSSVGNGAGLPAGETAPVVHFGQVMNEKFNKLGNITFTVVNASVDGSVLNQGVGIIDSVLNTHNPDILYLVYGMNDQGYLMYYSGQTYPFVTSNLETIIAKANAVNCDVVVTTSPHMKTTAIPTTYNPDIPAVYPTSLSAPVNGEALTPKLSELKVTADWLGNGYSFDQYYLAYRVNQGQRFAALNMGASIIDVEHYWFEAVFYNGENALYDGGEIVHPNLLAHQLTYRRGNYDFVSSISESFLAGVQNNTKVSPRYGINTNAVDSALKVKPINTTDKLLSLVKRDGTELISVDKDGVFLSKNTVTAQGSLILVDNVYNRALRKRLVALRNYGTAVTIPIAASSWGEITVWSKQPGIGSRLEKRAFFNHEGTVTLTAPIYQQETAALAVVVVSASSSNIVLTPFTTGTDIDYVIEFMG
jgi:hypothetical protein